MVLKGSAASKRTPRSGAHNVSRGRRGWQTNRIAQRTGYTWCSRHGWADAGADRDQRVVVAVDVELSNGD